MTDNVGLTQLVLPPTRPEPRRDQWGRYLLPDLLTGEYHGWTRATTLAGTLDDTFALTQWQIRKAIRGISMKQDLSALAASVMDPDSPDGKKQLNKIADGAMEAGGRSERANLGTAVHAFAQALDIGRKPYVPPPWDADIRAYQDTCKEFGIVISPNYVERVAVIERLGIAGTMDRLARVKIGDQTHTVVADFKTGATLDFSWLKIAIQLSLYSRADRVWDTVDDRYYPMLPGVSQEWGLVLHLPAGEGKCTPYWINLEEGWKAAEVAMEVRAWRRRKNLHRVFTGK